MPPRCVDFAPLHRHIGQSPQSQTVDGGQTSIVAYTERIVCVSDRVRWMKRQLAKSDDAIKSVSRTVDIGFPKLVELSLVMLELGPDGGGVRLGLLLLQQQSGLLHPKPVALPVSTRSLDLV